MQVEAAILSHLSELEIKGDVVGRKRILLADDHVEMLDEIRSLLNEDYEIVGAVENGGNWWKPRKRCNPTLSSPTSACR